MKNGSKLASSAADGADLLGESACRHRVAPRRRVRLALGVQPRVGRGAVHRRGGDELASGVRNEHRNGPRRLAENRLHDRLCLFQLHSLSKSVRLSQTLRDSHMTNDIGIGMLGYAFMGKAHSRAFREIAHLDTPLQPRLVAVAGRNEDAVATVAAQFGYERWTTDWRDIVADPTIGLFDNGGPNSLHAEPTIAAAEAGKHVLCEKPLGRDADESYEIWQRWRRRASSTSAASTTASCRRCGWPAS